MSTFTSLVATGMVDLAEVSRLLDRMDEEIDVTTLRESDVLDDAPGKVIIEWHDRKWGVDGVHDLAQRLSAGWPTALVEVHEEWNASDADEQGETAHRYRDGVLVEQAEMKLVWTKVTF